MIDVRAEGSVPPAPELLGPLVSDPPRIPGRFTFAASTEFTIALVPEAAGTRVLLHSVQEPSGPLRGLVIRAFGRREVAQSLRASVERLAAAMS